MEMWRTVWIAGGAGEGGGGPARIRDRVRRASRQAPASPRADTFWIVTRRWPSHSSVKNQIAHRRDHRSRHDHRNFRVLDLTGRGPAHLTRRLDYQLESVHVALGQVSAAGVDRQPAAGPGEIFERAEIHHLVRMTKAVLHETRHHRAGEVFIDLRDIDVTRFA